MRQMVIYVASVWMDIVLVKKIFLTSILILIVIFNIMANMVWMLDQRIITIVSYIGITTVFVLMVKMHYES